MRKTESSERSKRGRFNSEADREEGEAKSRGRRDREGGGWSFRMKRACVCVSVCVYWRLRWCVRVSALDVLFVNL